MFAVPHILLRRRINLFDNIAPMCCSSNRFSKTAMPFAGSRISRRNALRLAPASPDSYTYYARYLLSHSRAEEARLFLRSALELSPTDLTARELIAQTDAQAPPHSAGETPESYLVLSLQYYREARYAESIAACRAALALRANYAEAWNNIGAAYNKLRRYDEAAASCAEALRLKPDFELAQNNLQYAREMAKTSGK